MSDFDHVFEQLEQVTKNFNPALSMPQVEAEGHSDGEEVRVRIAGGKVIGVDIDVRATRLPNADLCAHVVTAINDAMEKHTHAMVEAMQGDDSEFGVMQRNLDQVRDEARQTMNSYLGSMSDMLRQASGQRDQL